MKRTLEALAWIVGGLVLSILLATGIGAMLPVEHTARVSRVVRGSSEQAWEAITAVEGFAAWRPDVDRAERLPSPGLPRWREEGPSGVLTFQVVELEAPRRMVTQVGDEGLPFGGSWTYQLEPAEGGTRVTITENGEIYNPVYRVVSRYLLGYDATMVRYLDALAARLTGEGP